LWEFTLATGPSQPEAGDQAYWEADQSATASERETAVHPKPAPGLAAVDLKEFERVPQSEPWRLRHMMYLVAAVAVMMWLGILAFGSIVFGILAVAGGVVVLFAGVMGTGVILARSRAAGQDSLLSVLAIAAERSMPLAPAVAAFADQYRGLTYRRIMNLAAQLNWGTALPEAFERARKVVSRDAILLTWVGHETGTLPRALRLAAATRSNMLPIWTAIAARLSYILALLLAMQTICGFIFYFIIPRLESIFYDFSLALPRITILTIEASSWVIRYGYITIWIPLIEAVLLIFLPLSLLGWGRVHVPLFDRLMGRRHTALVLRSLSLAVEGTKPIAVGLATLADHYPTRWIRRRLVRVRDDARAGADWIDSLRYRRVIRASDAEVIRSAGAVGNLSWALTELADTIERRLAARAHTLVQTIFPLAVVMLGVVVFILAIAYFIPLVQLITELANQ
jgi:type II secretory pathway component PulF